VRLKRDSIRVFRLGDNNDDGFVRGEPSELFEMVWEITCDVWAFGGKQSVERRLQRNVTNLVRRRS
jgi:hypothetical protein